MPPADAELRSNHYDEPHVRLRSRNEKSKETIARISASTSRNSGLAIRRPVATLSFGHMMPSGDFRSRALAATAREPLVTRRAVLLRNAALFVSGFVVPLGVFLESGGMRAETRPDTLVFQTAFGAGIVALTALVVALGRGRSTLGRPGMILLGLALATPIVMFAWKLAVSSHFPGMTDPSADRPGFRCLQLSCLLSAWPLVAIVMTRRGTDPVHPRLTGAAIGAAVGACSWVFVDLWCSVAYVPHLLLGHVLPVILSTAAGAALGNVIALRRP